MRTTGMGESGEVSRLKRELEKARGEVEGGRKELGELRVRYEEAVHREGEWEGRSEAQFQHLSKL